MYESFCAVSEEPDSTCFIMSHKFYRAPGISCSASNNDVEDVSASYNLEQRDPVRYECSYKIFSGREAIS